MMLTGLPKTLPPKSSTAICAAVTDPWPVGVDAGPFISVRTPILTTSSDTCANAAGTGDIADANAASMDILLAEITKRPPVLSGALALLIDRSFGASGCRAVMSAVCVNAADGIKRPNRMSPRVPHQQLPSSGPAGSGLFAPK